MYEVRVKSGEGLDAEVWYARFNDMERDIRIEGTVMRFMEPTHFGAVQDVFNNIDVRDSRVEWRRAVAVEWWPVEGVYGINIFSDGALELLLRYPKTVSV